MLEIERKFLVKYLPDLTGIESSVIKQSYLNDYYDMTEIRLRNYDDERYYLDFKSKGHMMIREENGVKITKEQYDKLNTTEKHIIKKRYYFGDGVFLDIYQNIDLVVVEKEGTYEDVVNFEVPDWFGEDVTKEKKYKNCDLFFSL